MNNEEAIEYLKNYKYDNEVRQAIDTVLNYIEELEKENKFYEKYAVIMSTEGLLINGVKFSFNDYIPKQKVRDKIEELEKQTSTINDKQISKKYSHTQFARECCIGLLKELLEEEK